MTPLLLLAIVIALVVFSTALSFLILYGVVKAFRVPDAPLRKIVKVFLLLLAVGIVTSVLGQSSAAMELILFFPAALLAIYIFKHHFALTWKRSIGIYLVNAGLSLVLLAGPAYALREYGLQAFRIPSGAMVPTLLVGDHLLAEKFSYRSRAPRRGEIAVFRFPQDRETNFLKRVVALPGEEVALRDGTLLINGERVADIHAVYTAERARGRSREFAPFRVPARGDIISLDDPQVELYRYLIANEVGERGSIVDGRLHIDGEEAATYEVRKDYYFLMGDNRDNSYDSRFWGPVMVDDIYARALILYWSYGDGPTDVRWGRIGKSLVESSPAPPRP